MKKKDLIISLGIIGATALIVGVCLKAKGYVRIDAGGAAAELQLRNAWFTGRTITSDEQAVEVGARVYNTRRLNISAKQSGHAWGIECLGPWGDLSRITVRRNKTTELRLGPPLLVKPDVKRSGSVVSIGYAIIGRGGEHYRGFVTRDGRAAPGAKINILDEAGKVLETGQFSYG